MQRQKTIEEVYAEGFISKETNFATDFKAGDRVIYTNEYGAEFERTILGFSIPSNEWSKGENSSGEKLFIHMCENENTLGWGSWWFPRANKDFRKKI